MKGSATVTVEGLREEPYASIVCYPRPSKVELNKRLKELKTLGVKALEFSGEKEAFGISVLGKGCVGIVTIAYRGREKIALKIRRVDADRSRMEREAEMLRKANGVGVGPKLFDVSKNFLLMQFVEGDLLPKWLDLSRKKAEVKRVLRDVLEQCRRLDVAGLDHGELSHAPKHVIVDLANKPFIVDFESASLTRKVANVTSLCQFLFISGLVAEKVHEIFGGGLNKMVIIKALRRYKNDITSENFKSVLNACGL